MYKTDGTQINCEYDVNGSRVRNTIQGSNGSDNFYFNGADGKTEAVGLAAYDSNMVYNILGAGGDNIGQVKVAKKTTKRYYYLKDHLGSIKMTVDTTGNNIVGYDDYYPYGALMRSSISSADGRYMFTGKERDASTGLDYFGARYYDSWSVRWDQVDPLENKYPSLSPYNYAKNNPLRFIDLDGMGAKDEVLFALRHPTIAFRIGSVTQMGTNISSISQRFAANIGLLENKQHEGSEVNAFRHVLWQASITSRYGADIANQVGNAHEQDPNVDLSIRTFSGNNPLDQADQSIDLLNNQIGRKIGESNSSTSQQELALKTLDYFFNEGLYTAVPNSDGTISIVKTKISKDEYNNAKANIKNLNQNGFNKSEQMEKDANYMEEYQRYLEIMGGK
jgi:RHS repeat-associated protein